MPPWAALALAVLAVVWSFGIGFAVEGGFVRWVVRVTGPRRTVARTLAWHLALLLACFAHLAVAGAVRDATQPASWAAGAVVLVGVAALGPVVLNLSPGRTSISPDRQALLDAGATPGQADVVRRLGLPFAVLEVVCVIGAVIAGLAP